MYVIFIIENYNDVMETVLVVSSFAVNFTCGGKVIVFWHYLDRVHALMRDLQTGGKISILINLLVINYDHYPLSRC
jgi:hypothetical protein